ncbi:MAG: hypothetical protein J4G05_10075, partial [Chlorobi bacterium]|nr:hypothetical protein [Chlorobiota bacterium]
VWGGRDPGKYIVVKLLHLLHFRLECGDKDFRVNKALGFSNGEGIDSHGIESFWSFPACGRQVGVVIEIWIIPL